MGRVFTRLLGDGARGAATPVGDASISERDATARPRPGGQGGWCGERVDSAMRGSSISFLTRARSAWLDSCIGWLLCILVRCHVSKGITGQLGTALTVLELSFLASSFDVSGRLPVIARLALDGLPRRAGLRYDDRYYKSKT